MTDFRTAEQWRLRAACRGQDPAVFFPVGEDDEQAAKAVCGTCEVQNVCLEVALASRETACGAG